MPGEVLSDPADLRVPHPRKERARQCGHHVGIVVERAVTDHRAHPAAQIEHRRKAEIDAGRTQLDRRHPSAGARGAARLPRIPVMEPPVLRRGGKGAEAVPKALHPTAFVVDRDEQGRLPQGVDGVAQGP